MHLRIPFMSSDRTVLCGLCLSIVLVASTSSAQTDLPQFSAYEARFRPAADIVRLSRPLFSNARGVQLVPDVEGNRVLYSGTDSLKQEIRRVLAEMDRPAATTEPPPPTAAIPSITRTYAIQPRQQEQFLEQVYRRFGRSGVETSVDPSRGRVFVKAPPDVHRELSQLSGSAIQPNTLRSAPGEVSQIRFVFVPTEKLGYLQQQLMGLFGRRLSTVGEPNNRRLILEVAARPPRYLEVIHNPSRGGVEIHGEGVGVAQLATLVRALIYNSGNANNDMRVLRLERTRHNSLKNIVWPPEPGNGAPTDQSGTAHAAPILPVTFQQPAPGPAPAVQPGPNALRQFEGVEIESLPELDVIILRGRDQDLQQLEGIIRQLERIGQETQPEVKIIYLRQAASQAIAELVNETSADIVNARTGTASVTPLVKPNAVLVIGWGEAVVAIENLVRDLDKPVAPQSQSAVFRLQYASAEEVSQTLDSFFGDRGGLGPQIQVTVDNRTNSLIAHAAPRDMQEVARIIRDLDRPGSSAVNRARIFPIENALASDVATTLQQAIDASRSGEGRSAVLELQTFDAEGQRILRSGTLEHVQITPNPRNNTLIVTSPQENLDLIAELIRQLDSPAAQSQIKVFRIVNGDAGSLVETLRSLLPAQIGGNVGPQLSVAPGEPSIAPLRFSVDIRSNSIIATGSEGDLRIVEALLVKLDQSTTMQRRTTVFQLKNSPAVDVATAVNQFLISRRQVEEAFPGDDNPFQDIEREVVVVPEPVANKLILAATPRYYEELVELIEQLDEQPPQVMIQVLIAEVALNDTDEFGVELGLQDSVLFDRSLLGDLLTTQNSAQSSTNQGIITATQEIIQSATNLPGFAFNSTQPLGNSGSDQALVTKDIVGGQGISNFAVGRGNEQLGFGGLVLSASSQNVNVLIRALQESRRVDILSRPQIRTLDNQPAFIQVGQRVPRIVGSTVNQNGQSNSVTLENVGLILGVTPRISPEGMVVMEIDAERSRVGPEAEGIPVAVSIDGTVIRSPRVETATAQATVSATDGETIVLGGLITEDKQQVHRQVPWLGDMPLLKHLFRFDGFASRRTELLIILTPRVIRSPLDSELIRQTEMARMSWCAADVVALHGDIGFRFDGPYEILESGQPEVIYPDDNPSGDVEYDPEDTMEPSPLPLQEIPPNY